MPQGRVAHPNIMQAEKKSGETAVGWFVHYGIGVVFALLLLAVVGQSWVISPSILPALIVGLVTVAMPFFLMQPAFGAGVAASKTPKPALARFRSIQAHLSFGVGLYLAALLCSIVFG